MMDTLNQLVIDLHRIYTSVPAGFWQALGASGILSPLGLTLKKWLEIESQRKYTIFWVGKKVRFTGEQVMLTLVGLLATLFSAIGYLLGTQTDSPTIIALHAAVVAFMSQPVYYFVVKPLSGKVAKWYAQAQLVNATKRSAKIPEGGVPLSNQ